MADEANGNQICNSQNQDTVHFLNELHLVSVHSYIPFKHSMLFTGQFFSLCTHVASNLVK